MKAQWTLRRLRRSLRRRFAQAALLLAAFVLLSGLAGAARLSSRLAESILPTIAEEVHVIAYLKDDMTARRAGALGALVREVPGVASVRLIESEEAFERLRTKMTELGGGQSAIIGIEEGFLPRSLEISLSASLAQAQVQRLAESLRRFEGIAEVDAMAAGVSRLHSLFSYLRWLGWGLLGLALIAGIAVLFLPLARGRQARDEEAAVLLMLGETPRAIRLPWVMMGALTALLGASVALGILYLGFQKILAILGDVLGGAQLQTSFLHPGEILIGFAAAIILGMYLGAKSISGARLRYA